MAFRAVTAEQSALPRPRLRPAYLPLLDGGGALPFQHVKERGEERAEQLLLNSVASSVLQAFGTVSGRVLLLVSSPPPSNGAPMARRLRPSLSRLFISAFVSLLVWPSNLFMLS